MVWFVSCFLLTQCSWTGSNCLYSPLLCGIFFCMPSSGWWRQCGIIAPKISFVNVSFLQLKGSIYRSGWLCGGCANCHRVIDGISSLGWNCLVKFRCCVKQCGTQVVHLLLWCCYVICLVCLALLSFKYKLAHFVFSHIYSCSHEPNHDIKNVPFWASRHVYTASTILWNHKFLITHLLSVTVWFSLSVLFHLDKPQDNWLFDLFWRVII